MRNPSRRLLQAAVAVLSLIPIGAGAAGVLLGPAMVDTAMAVPADLDSHFRYLSGIFLGLGIVFVSTVPAIERRSGRFRLAGALVICGGLARALSMAVHGVPSLPHLAGLGMELGVMPGLLIWQWAVARRGGG